MIYKLQYKNNEERLALLTEYKDKKLVEEQNLTEGNFLIFIDIEDNYESCSKTVVMNREDYEELQNELLLAIDKSEGGIF